MGERTEYSQGTFSWTDLATPDQEAAKTFYTGVFGWEYDDNPVGDGVVYSVAQVGGKTVAAISPQPQQQRDAGVPPVWNSYVTVDDVDATAARAGELGAQVHAGPFDVMEAGRMAVIQDPQGAFFMLWKGNQTAGAELVNAPGAFSWNELGSPDLDASAEFYSTLLGWKTEPMQDGDMDYRVITTADGTSNGGIRAPMPPDAPPFWLVYFVSDDLDATLAKVGEGGGNVLMGATDIGIAKIAIAQDPQGAVFALYAGRLDD